MKGCAGPAIEEVYCNGDVSHDRSFNVLVTSSIVIYSHVHTGRHGGFGVHAQPHAMMDSDRVLEPASMAKLEELAAKEAILMPNHAILK